MARQEADTTAAEVGRLEAGLREVRGKLEQRRNDSNSQNSQSAIVQALMKAKSSGQIPGIYGRLGESSIVIVFWQPYIRAMRIQGQRNDSLAVCMPHRARGIFGSLLCLEIMPTLADPKD